MELSTLIDLSSRSDERFFTARRKVTTMPFYGKVYNLTYGQGQSYHSCIESIIKSYFKEQAIPKLRTLEVFGGTATESHLLQNALGHKAYSVDIDYEPYTMRGSEASLYGNVKYLEGDCLDTDLVLGVYDLVFAGGAAVSHCVLRDEKMLVKHLEFVKSNLKEDGIFVVASFEDAITSDKPYYEALTSYELKYATGDMVGKWATWYCLGVLDANAQTHTYYSLVGISDTECGEFTEILGTVEGSTFKSWNADYLRGFLRASGFVLYEEQSGESRQLPYIYKPRG
jgi:hypothetical protein